MPTLWLGPALSATAVAALVAAFICGRTRPRAALAAILVFGGMLRLAAATRPGLNEWDERYHALVAKNLLEDPWTPRLYPIAPLDHDYRDWHANYVWLHKPPLALWLIALSLKLFGVHELAVRFPSILLTSFATWLTYDIGRRLIGRRVGLTAALLHAANPLIGKLATGRIATDHVDAIFSSLVTLGVWSIVVLSSRAALVRGLTVGVFAGLAVLTKWATGLLLPILLIVASRPRKSTPNPRAGLARAFIPALLAAAIAIGIALPWRLHTQSRFPREAAHEAAYNWEHIWTAAEGHAGGPLFHLIHQPRFFGELIWLALAWHTLALLRRRRSPRGWWLLLAWWLIPYLAFSLVATKMKGYIAPAAPAICLIAAHHWWWLHSIADRQSRRTFAPLRGLLLIALLLLPLKQAASLLEIDWQTPDTAGRRAAIIAVVRQCEPRPTALFNMPLPIEAMFHARTPLIAYPHAPSDDDLARVRAAGFEPAILDRPDEPPARPDLAGVWRIRAEAR